MTQRFNMKDQEWTDKRSIGDRKVSPALLFRLWENYCSIHLLILFELTEGLHAKFTINFCLSTPLIPSALHCSNERGQISGMRLDMQG